MDIHKGYFVITDITGYTAFMTSSELDHAQDILKTLFTNLQKNIKPPLVVSNYQGDAILMYVPEASFFQGQTLIEIIEVMYCEFADLLQKMHLNTTCTCKACKNIPNLDLKFFVHHGQYMLQTMLDGRQELSGPDVILVHRMTKNNVREKTDIHSYLLLTDTAVQSLELEKMALDMKKHSETYEHLGEVNMYVHCLKTVWNEARNKRRITITPEESWFSISANLPISPTLVWDYVIKPELKIRWLPVDSSTQKDERNRAGEGTLFHCAHGDTDFIQVVLDWKPFEYFTVVETVGDAKHLITNRILPTENGVRFEQHFGQSQGDAEADAATQAMYKDGLIKLCFDNLEKLIAADIAAGKIPSFKEATATAVQSN